MPDAVPTAHDRFVGQTRPKLNRHDPECSALPYFIPPGRTPVSFGVAIVLGHPGKKFIKLVFRYRRLDDQRTVFPHLQFQYITFSEFGRIKNISRQTQRQAIAPFRQLEFHSHPFVYTLTMRTLMYIVKEKKKKSAHLRTLFWCKYNLGIKKLVPIILRLVRPLDRHVDVIRLGLA